MPSNPPFDDRIRRWNIASGGAPPFAQNALQKGRMYNADYTSEGDKYVVNFLYNPSVIDVSHGVDLNWPDPSSMSTDDKGVLMGPLQQNLSFTLLFDRTYETWDQSYLNDTAGRGLLGVYVDIKAIYDLVGVTTTYKVDGSSTTAGQGWRGIGGKSVAPSGPMRMVPTRVLFAQDGGPLSFYGFISSLDIEYTHFTTGMIPNRATVGITLQLMIDPGPAGTFTNPVGVDSLGNPTTLGVPTSLASPPPGNVGTKTGGVKAR